MAPILIFDKDGARKFVLPCDYSQSYVVRAEKDVRLMEGDTITLDVESASALPLVMGDYLEFEGCKYRMNQLPRVEKMAGDRLLYTLVFESAKYDLVNVVMLLPDNTIGDMLTGNLRSFIQVVVDNANRVYPGEWSIGGLPTNNETKTKKFTEQNCLAALQAICEEWDYRFRVTEVNNLKSIEVFDEGTSSGVSFQYGEGRGLYTIVREATASEDVVTRLYAYGSGDNLNIGYRHSRLCLPELDKNQSYIEDADKVARYGVKEGIYINDDIKPTCKAVVSSIPRPPINATTVNQFMADSLAPTAQYGFDLQARWKLADYAEYLVVRGYEDSTSVYNYFVNNIVNTYKYLLGTAKVTFNTGKLMGYSFNIHHYDSATSLFELVPIVENEGRADEQKIPDASTTTYRIAVGDEFVISDISLPYSFVRRAESELMTEAREYYDHQSTECARYSVELDPVFMERYPSQGASLVVGNYVHIKDAEVGVDKDIRVWRIGRDLMEGTYAIEVSDIRKMQMTPIRRYEDMAVALEPEDGVPFTELTSVFTPNYNGNANTVHISAGVFTTNRFSGLMASWNVYERDVTDLISNQAYNVYLRAYKSRNYPYADISFVVALSLERRTLKGVTIGELALPQSDEYYYLKIGHLSAVTLRGLHGSRQLTLQYGYVQMSGSDINGGLILNRSGDTIVNLDSGVVQGDLYYRRGDNLVSVSELSTQVEAKADFKAVEDLSEEIKKIDVAIKGGMGGTRQYETITEFPTIGDTHYTYVDKSSGRAYAWNDEEGKEGYYCIGSDYKRVNLVKSSI